MNHMREAALTDEDGFPFDFDQQLPSIDPLSPETQCQFILKRNRKIPNRVIIGETGGATHTGNNSAERSDAVKLAAFISALRLGLDKLCRQNFEQNKRFLRAVPAGRISHFTSRIYPSLVKASYGSGKMHYVSKFKRSD